MRSHILASLFFCFVFTPLNLNASESFSTTVVIDTNLEVNPAEIFISPENKTWLSQKKELVLAVYGDAVPPFSIISMPGHYRGINADFIDLLQRTIKRNIIVRHYEKLSGALDSLRDGTSDLVMTSPGGPIPLGNSFITSSALIKTYPTLVTTESNLLVPLSLSSDEANIAISDSLIKNKDMHLNAKTTIYPNDFQALNSLIKGENNYYIGNNLTASFLLERDFHQKLVIAKYFDEKVDTTYFITNTNQKKLITLINNFIISLTPTIKNQVTQKWIGDGHYSFFENNVIFTSQEKEWIQSNKNLDVIVNPFYAPLTFVDNSMEIRGIVGDILNLIQLQTGISFTPIIANSNSEIIKIMRNKKWDILPTTTYSPEREEHINFTQPFITTPYVYVTLSENKSSITFKKGSKIAIPSYHTLSEKLKMKYKDIEWVDAQNTSDALSMLDRGKVDGVVSTQLAVTVIADHFFKNRFITSFIPDEKPAQISFAVPIEKKILKSILDKTLKSIQPREVLNISSKWEEIPEVKIETWNLYNQKFYLTILFSAILVLSSLIWGVYLLQAIRRKKKIQAELEYQLLFRQTLSDTIPVPVYAITLEGNIESYNKSFYAFFSDSLQRKITYSLFDRRHPLSDIFISIQKELEQEVTDKIVTKEFNLNNGNSNRIILHWATFLKVSGSTPKTLVCGWQDITESRDLMIQLQLAKDIAIESNEAKSSFLAHISHEIRTPISAILGLLELTVINNRSKDIDNIKLAYTSAQSLLGLIGNVLDLEKIESGLFELSPSWVPLNQLCLDTLQTFDGMATNKGLSLLINVEALQGKHYFIDSQAVRQILTNLIGNAVKFTENGFISLDTTVSKLSDRMDKVNIVISDSGEGISIEEQQNLFQKFQQASNGRKQMGSGLGLNICRDLLALFGGEIIFDSTPGKGTSVTITFSSEYTNDYALCSDDDYQTKINDDIISFHDDKFKILIADDNITNRLLLNKQLNLLGQQVSEAPDGIEALKLIKAHDFDILITDLNMPNMDGLQLTQEIRKFNKSILIWGLTANALAEKKESSLALGMNECYFKPLKIESLKNHLNQVRITRKESCISEHIDLTSLKTLTSNDMSLISKMLKQAIHDNKNDIKSARQALRNADDTLLARHIHRINGTLQIIGSTGISLLAENLENKILRSGINDSTDVDLDAIEIALDRLSKVLRIYLQ